MVKAKSKKNIRVGEADAEMGRRMRIARLEAGLSQERLAEKLGVTFQQIQKYEKGINRVASARLSVIASALGKPVLYFLPDIDAAPPKTADHNVLEEMMMAHGGVALARAFIRITDPKSRHLVIEMAEKFGGLVMDAALRTYTLKRGETLHGISINLLQD